MSRFTLFEAKERPAAPAPTAEPTCGVDRRQALALLSAAMTATLAACGKPHEEIVPYVEQPLGLSPGVAQTYATALTLNGYGRGVMAIAVDGRPIKIEGAPNHPYSLGSTDVFAEAEVLSLYDPSRARAVANADGPSSWEALQAALLPRLFGARSTGGEGVTLVTGRMVSPTDLRLLKALQTTFPKLSWRRFEPLNDDSARAGARLAFGRPLSVLPQLAKANVVLCLDADPLGAGPEQIANARGFVAARQAGGAQFS
ncbi:MAG: molybdopterin-binding domain-containing protein, partial [Caulobacteraceae bacterium]